MCGVYFSVHRQQSEEGEKNGSEDDDDEKPGKRVMGPRKKFLWDDKLRSGSDISHGSSCKCTRCVMMVSLQLSIDASRSLLCNLVRVKLSCYELEGKNSLSLEDYLKAFMETEVKPLWPKGWMQARCVSVDQNFLLSLLSHGPQCQTINATMSHKTEIFMEQHMPCYLASSYFLFNNNKSSFVSAGFI